MLKRVKFTKRRSLVAGVKCRPVCFGVEWRERGHGGNKLLFLHAQFVVSFSVFPPIPIIIIIIIIYWPLYFIIILFYIIIINYYWLFFSSSSSALLLVI